MPETRVLGRRVVAFLLDFVIFWALAAIPFLLFADSVPAELPSDSGLTASLTFGDTRRQVQGETAALVMLWWLALWFVVVGLLQGRGGFTPGKGLLGLRVIQADGRVPGVGRSIVRSFLWVADGFPYLLPGLLGFIVAAARPDRRRIGDMVAETYVVDAASAAGPGPSGASPGDWDHPRKGP